jgi:hypothetical protein
MARTRYTDEQKAEALALYETHGPTAVETQQGIPKNTVAGWAKAAGIRTVRNERTAAAVEAHALAWAERRAEMVDRIGTVASAALDLCASSIADGTTSKAKDAATTMAILVDKAQLLGGDATTRHENRELRDRLLEETRENARHLRSVA